MRKSTGYGTLFFLMAVLLITACASTTAEPPATAVATPVVADPTPTSQPTPTSPPSAPPLVLRNGLVVTATGADPIPDGAVVVADGLIAEVGPEFGITIPEDAIVIDLAGSTILPGLVDARASAILKSLLLTDGQIDEIHAKTYLGGPLKKGVTTLRATGWTWEEMQEMPELRKALEVFGNSIPTVVLLGASLAHSEGPAFTKHYPDQTVGVGTVDEARQRTMEIIDLGADQVNFTMSSGPSLSESPEERQPLLTLEMLKAIVETAHAQDTLVVGQALFPEEALTAIDAGVDELTAWPSLTEPMPDDLIEAIVSHSIPVISGFSVGVPQEGDVRRFLDAGGTLVFGTFSPNSGASPDREFGMMKLQGMTPMEMIQSATVNAANVVGLGGVVGTLEVGKQADIIVVDGNPFEDEFHTVFRNVTHVVKNGEIIVQPEE